MTQLDGKKGPALVFQDCTKSFRLKTGLVEALKGLNLTVAQGEVTGFLGPNGAGKTTAMHILLGYQQATSGRAEIFGVDSRKSPARQRIGYLPEHPQLYGYLTAMELLKAAGSLFGINRKTLAQRSGDLLERVGLAQAADRRIATFSRGMLQRMGIAQALINDPDLVIFDEPTNGLDPLGRLEVRRLIEELRRDGKTVFFSSHELSEAERVCDHVAILAQGRVVAEGSVDELVASGDSLERFFVRTVQQGGVSS